MGADLGTRKGPISDINVTPLIDVVLVLLVVFMVITPMLSSGLPVDLPMATTTVTVNDVGQHVVISVTKDGQWAVDQERVSDETEMMKYVNESRNENPERTILIKADRGLPYGDVRKVLDIMSENRLNSVFIAAGKEK